MKIFRVRRGFTTNSSGANEWLPSTSPPPPRESILLTNALTLGGIVAFVALMFLLEKLIKKLIFKKKVDHHEKTSQ